MTQPTATKVRASEAHPGLAYELKAAGDGVFFVVFRYRAGAFTAYDLRAGVATCVDCSDKYVMPFPVARHCTEVARQLANRLTGQVAA